MSFKMCCFVVVIVLRVVIHQHQVPVRYVYAQPLVCLEQARNTLNQCPSKWRGVSQVTFHALISNIRHDSFNTP